MRPVRMFAAGVLVALVASCGGSRKERNADTTASSAEPTSASESPSSLPLDSHADFGGLAFDYPSVWTRQQFTRVSSFTNLLTYLSPLSLHDPCTRTENSESIRIDCGAPLDQLDPGTILVTWENIGFPHSADQPEVPQPNTTLGGQVARVESVMTPVCSPLGGDSSIVADIARPMGNHYELRACIRGPGAADMQATVHAMLKTVVVTQ